MGFLISISLFVTLVSAFMSVWAIHDLIGEWREDGPLFNLFKIIVTGLLLICFVSGLVLVVAISLGEYP